MLSEDYEISRIGIEFGEDIDNTEHVLLKSGIYLNKDKANQIIENTKNESENKFDAAYNIILKFDVKDGDNELINQVLEDIQNKTKREKDNQLYNFIVGQDFFDVKYHKGGNQVILCINLGNAYQEKIKNYIAPFQELGLLDIAETQNNNIQLKMETKYSGQEIIDQLVLGERALSVLLHNFKYETIINLHKELYPKVKNLISGIDEGFANSPPMMLLKYFKNMDIDLSYESTQELPENIRNELFLGKMFKIPNSKNDYSNDEDLEETNKFLKFLLQLNQNMTVHFAIPDLLLIEVEGHNLAISEFINIYLQNLKNL